jgi:Flp pilus assembly pilin Flp
MFQRLFREEKGQDMIEYALLGSFISIVAILAIQAIGPLVNTIYENIRDALTPPAP